MIFFLQKKIFLLIGHLAIIFFNYSYAGRYLIPEDENVLIQIKREKWGHMGLNPNSIKLLVWNIYKGKKRQWRSDYLRLSEDKDLLLLQEVFLSKKMHDFFLKDKNLNYRIATSYVDTKLSNVPTGVGTASNVMPLSSSWLRSPNTEPLTKTPKMIMLAEYPLSGTYKTVLTANIHAINFVSAKKFKNMLDQLEDVLLHHHGPMILGGDFNTWNKEKIHILRNMVERLRLSEVMFKNDDRLRVFGLPLDYIFVREFEVLNSRVYGKVKSSDHSALEVELKLK